MESGADGETLVYASRMAAILGGPDWARARDFKRWAAEHPKRNTIMAFLANLDG